MRVHWVSVPFLVYICLTDFGAAAECHRETCGSMNVSYPFWIREPDCGQPGFQIKCKRDNSTGELATFLPASVEDNTTGYNNSGYKDVDFKIMKINYTGYVVIDSTSLKSELCSPAENAKKMFQLSPEGPFTISKSNKFVAIGCYIFGSISYGDWGEKRCESGCVSKRHPPYCRNGCCEIVLEDDSKWVSFTGGSLPLPPNSNITGYSDCGFSTIFDPATFVEDGHKAYYGLRLNWIQNCAMANYSCHVNAECIHSETGEGHVCKCSPGYQGRGNSRGTACTDIDECSDSDLNKCAAPPKGVCHNLTGNYTCSCGKGYKGNGFDCESPTSKTSLITAIIGSVSSLVGVSLGACGLFWLLRRRRLKNARDKYFQQNGGLQLQEHIASLGGRKSMTIFSEKELEIASKNYSTELGRGGFATVFKGVILDGTPVAIKKPREISGEFINEIIIFSYINHRNIVRLLGCCLQTQFPLLVYEFVPNGTLYEHLQSVEKHLPWETRRQIAIEAADAIAYMHLQASQPIFHRDIKSSNILLDDTFTPKISDFGISRLRPCDETHLSTMAVGTRGYLDPEFVRTEQFTDKSDVFSFGVVLVELLTGLNPVLSVKGTVCTLYDHFLSTINRGRLIEILDPKVVNKDNQVQMEDMARLAKTCLQVKAKVRPSMREVVEELAWIRAARKQSGVYRDASLVEHKGESMHDYTSPAVGESTCEDLYPCPASTEIITSEFPSTALISESQVLDMHGR